MSALLLAARAILATVLGVAGIAKLADPRGARRAMLDFGLPTRASTIAGIGVPAAELMAAAALCFAETARWGAVAAMCLLAAFLVAIAGNLHFRRAPDCQCFGRLRSEPIGRATMIRNGIFFALATLVAVQPGQIGPTDATGEGVVDWWFGIAVSAATIVWMLLPRLASARRTRGGKLDRPIAAAPEAIVEQRALAEQSRGLPVGTPAPDFLLPGPNGLVSLDDLRAMRRPLVLLFLGPECWICAEMLPEVRRWHDDHGDRIALAIVSRGTDEANRRKFGRLDAPPVLRQSAREVSERYAILGTPSAVFVRPDGMIGSRSVIGYLPVRRLFETVLAAVHSAERRTREAGLMRAADARAVQPQSR